MATSTTPKSPFSIASGDVYVEQRPHNYRSSHTHDEGDLRRKAARQPDVHILPRPLPARRPTLVEQNTINYQSRQNNSNEARAKRCWIQASLNLRQPHKKPERIPSNQHRQETESPPPYQVEYSSLNEAESLSPPYDIKITLSALSKLPSQSGSRI